MHMETNVMYIETKTVLLPKVLKNFAVNWRALVNSQDCDAQWPKDAPLSLDDDEVPFELCVLAEQIHISKPLGLIRNIRPIMGIN